MSNAIDTITAAIATSLQTLDLDGQVAILEGVVAEHGIAATADVIATHILSVSMDIDGGKYPPDLIVRVEHLKAQVREFNQRRFGPQ